MEFPLVENHRLAKTLAYLHGQIAGDLVASFPFECELIGTPQLAAVFQSHVMGVKKRTKFIDIHMHIEPQPVHSEWLFIAIKNASPSGGQTHGSYRLALLTASVIVP